MGRTTGLLLVAAACVLAGCSSTMETQVIRYDGLEGGSLPIHHEDPCDIPLVRTESEIPEHCVAIADVFQGDTGFSTSCGRKRVEGDVRDQLCALGSNLGYVRELEDVHSSCYQVRAVAYRCGAEAVSQ